ncbi:hypothetical protein HHK36_032164 [Tetracentron sinense]|uniref:RIN4 pathogenic type III effector avirulence factor Avr cleavage site domain-containing protein n=1 Tax=Tetracentron sinense TaxID=13715 RepID=A0A834Y7Q9_TETSI|nr:hypothetical protein HHK36_032164 [Tetracentron sinense]
MAAQQHSHVPKFGNWENDNVPYTTYFDNARKERGSGVRMNPNDPEENPDAFVSGGGHEGYNFHPAVRSPPIRVTSDKMMPAAKHYIEEHPNREQGHRRHNSHQINILDQQKSRNHKSTRSESGSDKSSSDHSLLQKNHRRARSEQNKNLGEGSNSSSPSVPHQPSRLRSGTGNHPSDNIPQRAASVPKFGAWDETDPKSGEGFTIIFNKVKEEKQIGAANFPTVPPQTNIYPNSHGSSSSEPKICCCLFPRGKK